MSDSWSVATAEMPPESPFRGLKQFTATEADAALFFGRDHDQKLIVSNLLASRLTLLYGQSGVGKSSILGAGVVNRLRHPDGHASVATNIAAVYVDQWHGDPQATILGKLQEEAQRLTGEDITPPAGELGFERALAWWSERLDALLLLVLDQFEQYCLHHPPASAHAFDRGLAGAIQCQSLRLRCLISLREDSLACLDRFKPYIPNLFAKRLRLDGLDEKGALEAISGPVKRFEEWHAPAPASAWLEPGLAETVVGELQALVAPLARGRGAPRALALSQRNGAQPIEPAYLQLVMQALWEHDSEGTSHSLRKATLSAMGGCEKIVHSHVRANLAGLSASQQAIAARSIFYLVTPSGAKVAYTIGDLAKYARAPATRVTETVNRLCEVRIMRPLPPADGSEEQRYEVFHDLLANPLLEWRAGFQAQRLGVRMRWALAALTAAVAAVLAIVAYNANPGPLRKLELSSIDTRFAIRGTIPPERDVEIVDVDTQTLQALNHGHLGDALRPDFARLIDRIFAGKPNVIGDDVYFHRAGDEDSLLAAIKRADGRIVLVSEEFNSSGQVPLFGREEEEGATSLLHELDNPQVGFGGFPLDPGQIYRRMQYSAPSVEGKSESALRSFAVAVAGLAEGRPIPHFSHTTLIDYHGPPRTFKSVSMLNVLRGLVPPTVFAGKIVLIGVTAPQGKDLHRTPFTSRATMPGVEIQANAIATVRKGPTLATAGAGFASLLIVLLSLTSLLVVFARWWIALAIYAAVACGYLLLAQLLFDDGLYIPLVAPLLALALSGLGTVLVRVALSRQAHAPRAQ